MLSFEEAADEVRKLAGKKPTPKSRFPTMSPEEQRTQLNTGPGARGPSKPNQSKTKPRAAGDPEPEEDSDPYRDLEKRASALGIAIPGLTDKPASALDEINAKAAELRKSDPTLSEAAAFTKVYESDRDLQGRHFQERMEVVRGLRAGSTVVDLGGGRHERVV
jgi:hypothetical protein